MDLLFQGTCRSSYPRSGVYGRRKCSVTMEASPSSGYEAWRRQKRPMTCWSCLGRCRPCQPQAWSRCQASRAILRLAPYPCTTYTSRRQSATPRQPCHSHPPHHRPPSTPQTQRTTTLTHRARPALAQQSYTPTTLSSCTTAGRKTKTPNEVLHLVRPRRKTA